MAVRICAVLIFLAQIGYAQDQTSWNFGIHGGYVVQNHLLSFPINNSFPIAISVGPRWSDQWHLNITYQWIRTEQISGTLHSFRALPGFTFWNVHNHDFYIESGLGYQYANFQPADSVRQIEWIVGPGWGWNCWDVLRLESRVQFVQAFDSFLHSGLRQWAWSVGLSYKWDHEKKQYAQTSDADQDGIKDDQDECKTTAFGIAVTSKGCPMDSDGDKIEDGNDYCSSTGQSDDVDEMGCPLHNQSRGILQNIEFENNSPRLTTNSKEQLGDIANELKTFPNLFFVVEGYASGSDPQSQGLSSARATSVMNILVSYGIPTYRIKSIGLGNDYPLVDENQRDQQLNDRIEIKWKTSP